MPLGLSRRGRRRRTTQRLVQFQQRTFIQRDQAAPRRIDVRNQRDDDGDEHWKNESLKNGVSPGSSRLVTDQPQAATRHDNKSSQTAPGTWLRLAAMRVASKSMVWLRLAIKLAVMATAALRRRRRPQPTYGPEAQRCVCASLRIDPKIAPRDAPRFEVEHTPEATAQR